MSGSWQLFGWRGDLVRAVAVVSLRGQLLQTRHEDEPGLGEDAHLVEPGWQVGAPRAEAQQAALPRAVDGRAVGLPGLLPGALGETSEGVLEEHEVDGVAAEAGIVEVPVLVRQELLDDQILVAQP